MNRKRIISLLLLFCICLTAVPFGALSVFAEGYNATDAMTDIKANLGTDSENTVNYQIGETVTANDGGYVGDIEITVFFDKANHTAVSGYYGSHLVMYVVNTNTERTGTKSDTEIIRSMLDRGYIVAVADYKNNPNANGTDLDFSLNLIRNKLIVKGNYLTDECFPSGTYRKHYIVPAGYDISPELVFWEADKHATDGTLEEIVDIWNTDLKGTKSQSYVKWTYVDENGNTVRKKVTDGAVWYSDTKGTVDAENGQYTMLKYTVAESIYDCVNPDGSPIDLNLYVNVIYPTNPEHDVPVIAQHNSSGSLWDVGSREDRPHFNGFLFNGYAGVCYDYLYVPMARDNSFGYFDGNDTGNYTGDPLSYSVDLYSDKLINTAAMRYIRYLSLSDHDTYAFDNSKIGVYGVSKGGTHPFLGEAILQDALVSNTVGLSKTERLNAINEKLCAFTEMRYLPGCTGATRYQNGKTETVTEKNVTIDGGELQPWLIYDENEIISGAQFIYASCPNNEEDLTEGHAPTFISVQLADTYYSSSYGTSPAYINLCRELDIPSVYFALDEGHTNCIGPDVNYGVVTLQAFYDFANYYLKGDAVKVLYVSPVNNSLATDVTSDITIKFTGPVSAEEVAAVTIKSSNGTELSGIWNAAFGNTEWTFSPDTSMKASDKYTVTVPATVKGDNGKEMGSVYTSVFTTEAAVEFEGEAVKNENGTLVTVTVPDLTTMPTEDYINALSLRMFVSSKNAANRLDVYSENASELIGSIYLKGAGFYSLDVSEYLSDYAAGETVTFLVKQGKTAMNDVEHYTEDFSSGLGDCTEGAYAQYQSVTFDGESTVKITITDDVVQYPKNPFYFTLSDILKNDDLIKSGKIDGSDYGRRFTVSIRVYDTVSRRVQLQMASCDSAKTYKTLDTDRVINNFTTTAGEWVTFTLDYTVYDSDYGLGGDHVQSLSVLLAPDGATESPIYVDKITVTETVTDVEFSNVTLVAYSEGDYSYKAPTGDKPLSLYDANGSFVASYNTWNEALSAYSDGYTLKLEKDYVYTSEHAFSSFATLDEVNIDLNGYTVYCEGSTSLILLKTNSSAIAETTVNIYGGNVFLTGAPLIGYDGSTSAGAGKAYNVNATELNVITNEGFTPYSVVSAFSITSGCTVNTDITLTDCSFELKNDGLATWEITIFKSATGSLTTNYSVVGGSIKLDSFKKVSVCDADADIEFLPSSEVYTTLTVPSYVTVPSASYSTDTGYRTYMTESTGDDWYNYSLIQDELSTIYGVIPEKYADVELYPFVVFNANGEFQLATDAWGIDGKASVLHSLISSGDGAVALLRRNYTFDSASGFNNLSQIPGTVTIDLGEKTLTANTTQVLFNAEAKTNYESTLVVKNGTIRTAKSAIVRFSSTNGAFYNGNKNFNALFDKVTLGFAEGASLTNFISTTWSAATAKPANANLTLKDCEIDLATNAPTAQYNVFNANDGNSNTKVNVEVIGGSITANSLSNATLVTVNAKNGSGIVMKKDYNGAYTKLYLKDTSKLFGDALATESDGYKAYAATEAVNEEGYTECMLSTDLIVTDYGVVSPEYADKTFVAFSNGVCIGASNVFNGTTSDEKNKTSIIAIANRYMVSNDLSKVDSEGLFPDSAISVQIVLLKDYSMLAETFDNLAYVRGSLTIDLNKKTITQYNNWELFRVHAKISASENVAYLTKVTVKNGNILIGNGAIMRVGSSSAIDGKRFSMNFEDVNFSLKSGSTVTTPFVTYYKEADLAPRFDFNFKDCTFDLTNATKTITLFNANDPTATRSGSNCEKRYIMNFSLSGCDIKAKSLSSVTVWGTFNSLSSYTYEKSEKTGLYTTLTLPDSVTAPTGTVTIGKETLGYAVQEQAGGYITYALGEITKYGVIPPKYSSPNDFPFILFHNGKCVFAHNVLMANTTTQTDGIFNYARILGRDNANQTLTILLRKDYTHNGRRYDNLTQLRSPITFDLNGFTLANNSTGALFQMQMKGDNSGTTDYETLVKVINGTVLLSKSPLVHYTIYGTSFLGDKQMTLMLENVKLNFAAGATATNLVSCDLDDTRLKDKDLPISYANLNLVSCTLDLTNAPEGFTLINAKDSNYNATYPKIRVTAVIKGGKIVNDTSNLVWFTTNASDKTGSALVFEKYDGSYTVLTLPEGVNAPTDTFDTAENYKAVFSKVEGSETDYTLVRIFVTSITLPADGESYTYKVGYSDGTYKEFTVTEGYKNGLATLNGYIVSLEGNIGVKSFMNIPAFANTDKLYVKFTVDGVETVQYFSVAENNASYGYGFKGMVAAAQMTSDIKIELCYDGIVLLTDTISVAGYAKTILDNEDNLAEYTKAQPVVKAMLNYGAAAQTQFGINLDKPANSIVSDVTVGDNKDAINAAAKSTKGENIAGVTYKSTTLGLESETALYHFFNVTDTDISKYTVVGADEVVMLGNVLRVKIAGIEAANLSTEYEVSVTYGGETITVNANAMAYAKAVVNSDSVSAELKTLMNALYEYNVAMVEYNG